MGFPFNGRFMARGFHIFMVPKQTPNKLSAGIENNSQLDLRLNLLPKQAYSIDYEQLF